MLLDLHVKGLGVIEDASLQFGPGLTALSGETGAGKTLLVDALDLVMGGRPKRGLVPTGRTALIEARFLDQEGNEVILAREIPAEGRARAWIDGRMASVSALAERAAGVCDIHGQHEHQSLLTPGAFRRALDLFGSIDTASLRRSRQNLAALERERLALGGTPEEIARQRDLLEYQINEIALAEITAPDEVDRLLESAKLLEGAGALRGALALGVESLEADGQASTRDLLATLRNSLEGFDSLGDLAHSLFDAETMLDELLTQVRQAAESVEEDPERLYAVNQRLELLHQLNRRYGPTLSDVLTHQKEFEAELAVLNDAELARTSVHDRTAAAERALLEASEEVFAARKAAAPLMTAALSEQLSKLAMERSQLEIEVTGEAGDNVVLRFSANPGLPMAPFDGVASGGELARLMLAIRLALPGGPPTMVFDEVDAGIGGAIAVTLAAALRDVARSHQVLVVTHLAQIAAAADQQISVVKDPQEATTIARAFVLSEQERVEEVARMLSGNPESETALRHARELLGL